MIELPETELLITPVSLFNMLPLQARIIIFNSYRFRSSFLKPQPLVGPLEPNTLLENPLRLFKRQISGPEHLMTRDKVIFTSTHTGDVLKILDENITVLGQFGRNCCELSSFSITALKRFELF